MSVCSLAVYASFSRIEFSLTLARLALAQIALVVVLFAMGHLLSAGNSSTSQPPAAASTWTRFTLVDLAAVVTYGVVVLGVFRPGAFGMGDYFPRNLSRTASIVVVLGGALVLSLVAVALFAQVFRASRPGQFHRTVIWSVLLTPIWLPLLAVLVSIPMLDSSPEPVPWLVLPVAAATTWGNLRVAHLAMEQRGVDRTRRGGRASAGQ